MLLQWAVPSTGYTLNLFTYTLIFYIIVTFTFFHLQFFLSIFIAKTCVKVSSQRRYKQSDDQGYN